MSEQQNNASVWGFIKGFGKLLIGFLLVLQGIIGLMVMVLVVSVIVGLSNGVSGGETKDVTTIPDDVALVINPNGVLVEQAEVMDPFEQAIQDAYGVDEPQEIEVHDLVRVIRKAKDDKRIKGLVLDLGAMGIPTSSASKLHYLADELAKFKESEKPIYAIGDYYSQEQYLLAAQADEVYLHDRGSLVMVGYGSYGTYLKSFLDKLLITPHVFRVGTFKAAVEPFLRDDMSPEAKEANLGFLSVMWDRYGNMVESARGLPAGSVKDYADNFTEILKAADGDLAQAAFDAKLVDGLMSRNEQLDTLKKVFGEDTDNDSYKSVDYRRYLKAVGQSPKDGEAPNVAIVTAAGTIVDGDAPVGSAAGGDTVAGYLKKALEDDNVKAVVLRVDSPGGSAFASEIIRDRVIDLKDAGKPVVVSMGSLAASGGYWVSAPADEIWAAPTTITGSIGIFAFFTTFENAAAEWGINVDGVGTSAFSSLYGTGIGPLEDNVAEIFQLSVESGYKDFIDVVAEGRDLTPEYVDTIGQGRVWIGKRAHELKHDDKLGTIDEAVASAAALAGLEDYDQVEMIEEVSPFDAFFSSFTVKTLAGLGVKETTLRRRHRAIDQVIEKIDDRLEFFNTFNDPNATYARCVACDF